ncbi:MAG: chromosomal replication initiator protein DnaA [Planctomycetes bacterium]|nr:chromosomal replication initiator protein DnaA [Planctomycetota bacterium]
MSISPKSESHSHDTAPRDALRVRIGDAVPCSLPGEQASRGFSWERFIAALSGKVARAQFESWLDRLVCVRFDDASLTLLAPNRFICDWVHNHYLTQIVEASQRIDGLARTVRLEVASCAEELEPYPGIGALRRGEVLAGLPIEAIVPLESTEPAPVQDADALTFDESAGPEPLSVRRPKTSTGRFHPASLDFFSKHSDFQLNDEYTFENFVTGSCNELAAAAARAVAEFPGGRYNPLFIHGASGLGKTHLLQAICHAVLRSERPRRVLYLSCENFVNQFIQAVTNGELEPFRYKYRKVDLLLIDDIQFLENKSRTQEEFFHTFNTLYSAKKQIVLSSDRPPSAIETLQDRLVSRFRWGMVTPIEKPALETRIAILRRKARLWGVELDNDVAQFLAECVDTNIRELEGAVVKVIAHAELVGRKLDYRTAAEVMRDYIPARSPVTVQRIIEVVADEFQVQPKDLQSKRRIHSVVLPRQVGMFLARKHTRMSLDEIGGFFGGRDHSTVLHSVRKIERVLPEDSELSARVERLSNDFAS